MLKTPGNPTLECSHYCQGFLFIQDCLLIVRMKCSSVKMVPFQMNFPISASSINYTLNVVNSSTSMIGFM